MATQAQKQRDIDSLNDAEYETYESAPATMTHEQALARAKNVTPTAPADLARINKAFKDLDGLINSLYSRWLDENGLEDVETYRAPIQKRLPKGFKVTAMTRRPFGFKFNIGTAAEYEMTISKGQYRWSRATAK